MFATAITAWRMSHPLNSPRFRPARGATVRLTVRSLFMGNIPFLSVYLFPVNEDVYEAPILPDAPGRLSSATMNLP